MGEFVMVNSVSSSTQTYPLEQINKKSMNAAYSLNETYDSLRNRVGAGSEGITKGELFSYLQKLTFKGNASIAEIAYIRNLITNFDSLSGDSLYLKTLNKNTGSKEPQDPSTITAEQLESPIDIRV